MSDKRRSMKSAPKDGTMIILTIDHGWSGEEVEVAGCWMAPGGDPSLEDWWCASTVTGTGDLNGLPMRIDHSAITPKKWRPLTHRHYQP